MNGWKLETHPALSRNSYYFSMLEIRIRRDTTTTAPPVPACPMLGTLGEVRATHRAVTETEAENTRLRREVAELRMERDILKKATAYFAKGLV